MELITLELPTSAAKKFNILTADEKNALIALVTSFLTKKKPVPKSETTIDVKAVEELFAIMDKISIEAEKNGMTEEILNEILNEH